jgi:GNAT superfamily N-acetyltransferase
MIVHDDVTIRAALLEDAEDISALIAAALRRTNAPDYPITVIDRMAVSYGPSRVAMMIRQREMFVAERRGLIVGTIGYAAGTVRSLFVAPDCQGTGIGHRLIHEVESLARKAGLQSITVAASLTARGFYQHCGFEELRPVDPSGIAMVLMHKWLLPPITDSHLRYEFP